MREHLYIRIGSQESDPIQWLITAPEQEDEIASGELSGKNELTELTEKASQRQVTVLVNSADLRLHSLIVPGKAERAIKAAAPYMLEEELAQDVEDLFFAYASKPKTHHGEENCFVAVVAHELIERWQSWFAEAGISVKTMIPDVLGLPEHENSWSAISINEQMILRSGAWQGFVIDHAIADIVVSSQLKTLDEEQTQSMHAFSPLDIDNEKLHIDNHAEELPLLFLAKNIDQQSFNLLQGEYLIKEQRSPLVKNWLWVAGLAGFALVLNLFGKVFELNQLNTKYEQISERIEQDYKQAFPNTKRVRLTTVKRQLSAKLAEYGGGTGSSGLLTMLEQVQPAFAKVPSLKPESVRFDGKRQELRLSVTAKTYQNLEQFKQMLEQSSLEVTTGAQNTQGESVTGSFSVRSKS